MLFGASDAYADDAIMQITVAFNHFGKGLVQRMPRLTNNYLLTKIQLIRDYLMLIYSILC